MSGHHAPKGKAFWLCLVAGWGVIVFGILGVLADADRTDPTNLAAWFVGSALAHDLLLAPLVFVFARWLKRIVPDRVRPVIHGGLIVAGSVTMAALPLVLGRGGAPGNASALPRNYPAGLVFVLGTVAVATGLLAWRAETNPGSSSDSD